MKLVIPAQPEPLKVDIARTALIVVDMQNAFCKKGGMMDYFGALPEDRVKRIIETAKKVIAAFRNKEIKVIYLRMTYGPDLTDAGILESPCYWKERGLKAIREHPELKGKFLTSGTWDWEIIDELRPHAEDIFINKSRFSGFVYTELDAILRTLNMKYLVFIGLFSNVCVESTIRDAFSHEYFPVLVNDACGNMGPDYLQEATAYNVSAVFGWVTTADEIIKVLNEIKNIS
jgi:ureidoacrylate peracid hydrolase